MECRLIEYATERVMRMTATKLSPGHFHHLLFAIFPIGDGLFQKSITTRGPLHSRALSTQ